MSGPAMLYQQAARLCSWSRDGGWPDKLTAEELARIQFPYVGSSEEKKRAASRRRDLLRLICKAISAGTLPAEMVVKPPCVAGINLQGWKRGNSGAGPADPFRYNIPHKDGWVFNWDWMASREWPGRAFSGANVRVGIVKTAPAPAETAVHVISPQDVAEWMTGIEESPSELVDAWLKAKMGVPASPAPKVAVTPSQPEEWSRGVKGVAWEVACNLMKKDGKISGPGLFDGIRAHQGITTRGDTLVFKAGTANLSSGEESVKEGTVKKDWSGKLKKLLNSSSR